ncbi:hypothetical protein ACOSQ3_009554 [Xanthoceras sorbifolium]
MSSRGDENPPSTSGRGYDDAINLSYDSWGKSEAASSGVTVASSSYDHVTVSSHVGTSHVMEEIPIGIPLVELPGNAAGPCPMGLSRPLGLLVTPPDPTRLDRPRERYRIFQYFLNSLYTFQTIENRINL